MRSSRWSLLAFTLGFTAAACSSDAATAPEASAPLHLAQIIAEMRLPALAHVGAVGPTATAAISLDASGALLSAWDATNGTSKADVVITIAGVTQPASST